MSNFKKTISNLLIILIIGGLGGIIADYFILPYLVNFPIFASLELVQRAKNGTTIINKTEEITVVENVAAEEAIHQASSCLAAIQLFSGEKIIKQGSGIIVTNDGLIATTADLALEKGAYRYLITLSNNISLEGKVIRQDKKRNLALIKLEANNLPVAVLSEPKDVRLGQRIILLGSQMENNKFNEFVNIGTIRGISSEAILINLEERNILANGGPLINIEGEIIGLNVIDQTGLVKTIPADLINGFLAL